MASTIVDRDSILLKLIAVSLLTSIATMSQAADVRAIAEAVDRHYNHLRTLECEFTETYSGSGSERTETGTLWLKKPGKMRWEYRSPRAKLFVGDGKNVWFYVPSERQVRKTSMKKLDDLRSPLAFLLGKTQLGKELLGLSLAPEVAPLASGDVMLKGVPKGFQDRLTQVLLEITAESSIRRIVMKETDGATIEYRFSEQNEDVAINDQHFEFRVPDGVEVVDENFGQ
ncbi:MAG TPA: outer membrane lipoprotein chaperone LolA [Terriglobales bacterium]|nr:outer membrane lipoprotein chaperone LolA [Terriglobales bacterium]